MINLVGFDRREKRLITDNLENKDILGYHVFNRYTSFYIKLSDLLEKNSLSWCNHSVFLPGVEVYNHPNYDGESQTQNILGSCKKLGLKSEAAEYCILKGGYLGTPEQLVLAFPLLDSDLVFWSSSQRGITNSMTVKNYITESFPKYKKYTVIPFYNKI